MTNEYNPDGKEIRFIDSHYKDLFHILSMIHLIIIQMLSVLTMSTATERDIHVVNMDVETIAVIKKNSKKYNTKGCVKVMGELS